MKNTMCLALIILAVLPASAQKAADRNRSANADDVVASAEDYAARVDGLLREVHASLQKISAQMAAGRLTPGQAEELKLAATRAMISRLDALAAIYAARRDPKAKTATTVEASAASGSGADDGVAAIVKTNGTVSVEQLKREWATAAATFRAAEISR